MVLVPPWPGWCHVRSEFPTPSRRGLSQFEQFVWRRPAMLSFLRELVLFDLVLSIYPFLHSRDGSNSRCNGS